MERNKHGLLKEEETNEHTNKMHTYSPVTYKNKFNLRKTSSLVCRAAVAQHVELIGVSDLFGVEVGHQPRTDFKYEATFPV